MGHVDHGKTSLLDYIRGSTIVAKEAGAITQHVGASSVPLEVIEKLCGPLLQKFKLKFTIPGLLFIDTPGHEAFTNLRKRGGSVADIAIVVIDIMQGIQPQTKEAIELLKSFKVPFVVAANKVDLIVGWKTHSLIHTENFKKQIQMTKEQFERKLYELVGQLAQLGFDSDIYTKVDNYTKRVSIVPISAKTGEGIAELLALLTGLAQKYLESNLKIKITGNAKGTILEIKEEKGLGTTADAIIYDGSLKVNDIILVGGLDKVIKTYVKGLLRPLPLVEMRAAGRKFEPVSEVHAATGVKIIAPELKDAIAGSPIVSVENEKTAKAAEKELAEEIEAITTNITTPGIILKTDALGSLEALSGMLSKKGIPIQRMGIGPVNKQDISQATANVGKSPLNTFVLGFNIPVEEDARELANKNGVTIINEPVIYHLIEKLETAIELKKAEQEKSELLGLVWPAKFKIIPGFVFRQTKPAVFGVEVMAGKLFPRTSLLTLDNRELGTIKSLEHEGEKLEFLEAGKQAAISVDGITIGRQLNEGDILYTSISEEHFRKLKDKRKLLNKAELEVMKEVAEIKRKQKPTWGL